MYKLAYISLMGRPMGFKGTLKNMFYSKIIQEIILRISLYL